MDNIEQYVEINALYKKMWGLEIRMESQEQYSRRKSLKLNNIQAGMSLEAGNRQKSSITLAVTAGYIFSLKKNWESIGDATAKLQFKIIWFCFINK